MKAVFTGASLRRLHEIQAYIAYDNARAATRVADRIIYVAEMLGDFRCWHRVARRKDARWSFRGYPIGSTTTLRATPFGYS